MMERTLFTLAVFITVSINAASQHRQFDTPYEAHAEAMYQDAESRYSVDKIAEMGLERWQTEFRKELKERLGISVIERLLPGFRPEAIMIRSEDVDYAVREWWSIRTEPDVVIPCVVLRPKEAQKRNYPLMITPHGHSKSTVIAAGIYENGEERKKGEEGERNVAVQAVKHGFIAIAPTSRGFGDTRLPKDIEQDNVSSCYDLYLKDALVGRTPVGDRVWDVMKIIDWALDSLPVDERNILISGNSGGGTVSLYAGAVDIRISMSLPASSFSDFSMSIGHRRHCSCNYIPGIMQLGGMGEIAGLTAPRYFCAIQGESDDLFPIEGAKKAFDITKYIYGIAGAPENCSLYVGKGGHRYYKDGAWRFITENLLNLEE